MLDVIDAQTALSKARLNEISAQYDYVRCKAQVVDAEIILADNGIPARMDGTFDIFVGNPPYYSDYRIADVFLETAKRALKPGGACYTVCKNAAGLEPVQKQHFPEVETKMRRNYAVLKSIKP